MHIIDDQLKTPSAWEGEMSIQGSTMGLGITGKVPFLKVGKPTCWSDADLLGEPQPAGQPRYMLVRLPFSVRTVPLQDILSLEFSVFLPTSEQANPAVFFDLLPKDLTPGQDGLLKVGIGSDFNFITTPARIKNAVSTIDMPYNMPVFSADGYSESTARWSFEGSNEIPLDGSQSVYCMIQHAPELPALRFSIQLHLEAVSRLGTVRGMLPSSASEALRFSIDIQH